MKNLLLFLILIIPYTGSSQKIKKLDKYLDYLLDIFPEDDKDFQITEAPAEYQNEPVVVLCQKRYMTFFNKRNPMLENTNKGITRRRVLIQDKSALDYYSEYYYHKSNHAAITLIKADGSEEEIDFMNAVEVSTEVPRHYRNNYSSETYYKIAIPNLEVGDIVDSYEIFKTGRFTDNFSNIFTISESFPIVHQEFLYDINGRWDCYINSYNGAPEFTSAKGGLNTNGKKTDKVIRYTLVDKNRAAQKYERWDFTYLSEPTIKYMVTDDRSPFGFDKPHSRSVIDFKNDIGRYLDAPSEYIKRFKGIINKKWETNHIKKLPTEEKVTQIYNVLKYYLLNDMVGEAKQKDIKAGNVFPFSQDYYTFRSDIFSLFFANLLDKYKVDFNIVVVVPKEFGFPEDVIASEELIFGVYVPSLDKYYWVPDNYTTAGDLSSSVFGASGYKVKSKNLKFKKVLLESIELPESKPEENVLNTDIDIQVEEDNTLTFDRTIQYFGSYKEVYSPLLLYNSAYAYNDIYQLRSKNDKKRLEVFNDKKKFKKKDWRAKQYAKKRAEQADELEEYENKKFELVKNWIESDFEVKEINSFEINTFGNESLTTPLECASNFSSDSYLKKAGPNLIFDIGSLITAQIQLDSDEIKDRTKPIEMKFAKTITNNINISIPEGMRVEGLESLTFNVDNEAASFISSAILEGNIIKLNTKKVYKQEFLELSNWPQLVEMLEAAYQFTQQKVVMKKN